MATAEIGTETFEVEATTVEGAGRDRLYAAMVARATQFAGYEARTSRKIPVLSLRRKIA